MRRVELEKVSIHNYFEEFSIKGSRKMEQMDRVWDMESREDIVLW